MIKNIIFDWSGVISDDFTQVYEAVMDVFIQEGIKKISKKQFREEFCLPYHHFYLKYIKKPDMEKFENKFREIFKTKTHPIPIEGVEPVLDYLTSKQINMVVLSSHHFVSEEIKKHFPGKKFFIRIFESVKDKEKIIEKVMQELGFKPEETMFVGDMVHDINAGKKAGVKTAAILTGYDSKEKLEKANPLFILNTLEDIKKII